MIDHYVDKIILVEHHDGWGCKLKPSPISPDWVSLATKGNPDGQYDAEGLCLPPAMARSLANALNEMADFCEAQKP